MLRFRGIGARASEPVNEDLPSSDPDNSSVESDGSYQAIPYLGDAGPPSGLPFFDRSLGIPVDVDNFVFRKFDVSGLTRLFGDWAQVNFKPCFAKHRNVTTDIFSKRTPGQNHVSSLFMATVGGWQLFLQNLSENRRTEAKTLLVEGLNMQGISAGYILPNDKSYVVTSKNFNVPVCIFDRVCLHAKIGLATLAVFGPKMPLADARNLWSNVQGSIHSTVDFDFAFEIPCPTGYPIFHSRFHRKKGYTSGTTRMFHTLGRGPVGHHEADFGTVRYQLPGTCHFITFYPKYVHLLKGNADFQAHQLPSNGLGLCVRQEKIVACAKLVRAELVENPVRWMVARVEISIRNFRTQRHEELEDAYTAACDILIQETSRIDCKIVSQEEMLVNLDSIISTDPFVGENTYRMVLDDNRRLATLHNQIGYWFAVWSRYLWDLAGLRDNTFLSVAPMAVIEDGQAFFVPPPRIRHHDEAESIRDYIFEVEDTANDCLKYTYMAPNVKNGQVSKKKHYGTAEEAVNAIMDMAATAGKHWRDYASKKKASSSVAELAPTPITSKKRTTCFPDSEDGSSRNLRSRGAVVHPAPGFP
jgi:hypothetical protein